MLGFPRRSARLGFHAQQAGHGRAPRETRRRQALRTPAWTGLSSRLPVVGWTGGTFSPAPATDQPAVGPGRGCAAPSSGLWLLVLPLKNMFRPERERQCVSPAGSVGDAEKVSELQILKFLNKFWVGVRSFPHL